MNWDRYDFVNVGSRTSGLLSRVGVGLHHSGVEVGGHEYSFNDAGVFRSPVNACAGGPEPQCALVSSTCLGVHVGSMNEFTGVVNGLRRDFPAGAYALTSKNCNHFADAFCRALGVGAIPAHINRMAGYGRWLGIGAKGLQVTDGGGGVAAPAPAPAKARADPAYSKKKALTAEQRAMIARIKGVS